MVRMGHVVYEPYEDLHKPGCLARHMGYEKNNSCSHRWQSQEKAKSDSRYSSVREVMEQPLKQETLDEKGDKWRRRVKVGMAMKTDNPLLFKIEPFATRYWPWHNQAHHIVPNGVLREIVLEFSTGIPGMQDLVFRGLLSEGYNLNDKLNMISLPTKEKDSMVIGLPTHPSGHPTYSGKLSMLVLMAIVRTYSSLKANMEELSKDHKRPETLKLKKELEAISEETYEVIWAYGKELKDGTATAANITYIPTKLFSGGL